jgi:multiple sugar transport system ATP-binding protein
VGIRSEDIRIGPDEGAAARVHDVENHGVEKIVTLRLDEHLFKATVPATAPVEVEDVVRFSWNPSKLHCFDRQTGTNLASGERFV